jgi:hypothetical protein
VDAVERDVTPAPDPRIAQLEHENTVLRRTNQRLAREKLAVADAAAATALRRRSHRDELPAGLEPVAAIGARVARGAATLILNLLPHALTLVLMRIRARLRQDDPT